MSNDYASAPQPSQPPSGQYPSGQYPTISQPPAVPPAPQAGQYQAPGQYQPYATPQPMPPQASAGQWTQSGPIASPYGAQPGTFPNAFAPAPVAPAPTPSPWMQPSFWVPKLPLIAIVVMAVCAVGGIVSLIYNLASGGLYVSAVSRLYLGLSSLIGDLVYGVAAGALIMGFAYLIEHVTAKHEGDDKQK